jgi:hypothetical protein
MWFLVAAARTPEPFSEIFGGVFALICFVTALVLILGGLVIGALVALMYWGIWSLIWHGVRSATQAGTAEAIREAQIRQPPVVQPPQHPIDGKSG